MGILSKLFGGGNENEEPQIVRDLEIPTAMIEHGWRFWPENTTEEEKKTAIAAYLDGGKPEWYPSGYVEPPIITTGKLNARSK